VRTVEQDVTVVTANCAAGMLKEIERALKRCAVELMAFAKRAARKFPPIGKGYSLGTVLLDVPGTALQELRASSPNSQP